MNVIANASKDDFRPRTIRYYGGKAKLADFIIDGMQQFGLKKGMSVLDAFSGSSVIAQELKQRQFRTSANDHLYFCYALADAHLGFNSKPNFKNLRINVDALQYLNNLPPKNGFMTKNYSPYENCSRMYLTVENANKVDAIRDQLEKWKIDGSINTSEFNYLLASLIYAVNLVSNITGTYGAFLKFWEGRSQKPLILSPIPIFRSDYKNKATCEDVLKAVNRDHFDFIYLDPPYNSRDYFSNYFLLEVIARGWHENVPIPLGVTGIPRNIQIRSDYSSKKDAGAAFQRLLSKCNSEFIALSYNNEGILAESKLLEILNDFGQVKRLSQEHRRYRSINQDGSKTYTEELLYIVRKK